MMNTALCVLLIANGHLIRDGIPVLGETQLARGLAGFWCLAGASIFLPWWAGVAICAGFWTDQKHAEGQNAQTWTDAAYLALSGITSLLPLALACAWFLDPWLGLIALTGLAKPPIWFLCRLICPGRFWPAAYPTRVAATLFGAVVGLVIALTA